MRRDRMIEEVTEKRLEQELSDRRGRHEGTKLSTTLGVVDFNGTRTSKVVTGLPSRAAGSGSTQVFTA
jgi:hypothetical protein